MQINKAMLDRLMSLDDESLRRMLTPLLPQLGIDEKAARSAMSDMSTVRSLISVLYMYGGIEQAISSVPDKELADKLRSLYGK